MTEPAPEAVVEEVVSEHVPTECDACHQVDTHPKVHYGVETYHHDCMSPEVRSEVFDSSVNVRSIIQAAESGVHGDDLRTHIQSLPPEPELAVVVDESDETPEATA